MFHLFIDVQPHFLQYASHPIALEQAIKEHYKQAKANGETCVILQTHNLTGQPTISSIIGEDEDIIVTKKFSNGFTQTDLAEQLEALGDKEMFVSGVYDRACVYFTCRESNERGFFLFSKEGLIAPHYNVKSFPGQERNARWLQQHITYL